MFAHIRRVPFPLKDNIYVVPRQRIIRHIDEVQPYIWKSSNICVLFITMFEPTTAIRRISCPLGFHTQVYARKVT